MKFITFLVFTQDYLKKKRVYLIISTITVGLCQKRATDVHLGWSGDPVLPFFDVHTLDRERRHK